MEKILELREKANKLPLLPGVYIMRDKAGTVIYVGKAKALKNRVTSYFRGEHLPKVAAMVSHVEDFEVIVVSSEFEALVLENSLIKQHQPHYNILLRDDKTYPFLRLNVNEPYPAFTVVNKPKQDGARYFGPYGSRGMSKSILETVEKALKLPSCGKKFPRDIGRERPCLNCHMNTCDGWCRGVPDETAYRERIDEAIRILSGDDKELIREMETRMQEASEELRFEKAAELRDRIRAVQGLSNRQTVIRSANADTDVIGFFRSAKTAFVVLHYAGGALTGKDTELMPEPMEDDGEAISALVRRYYAGRLNLPKILLLPEPTEDMEALQKLLSDGTGHRVEIVVPRMGIKRTLVETAQKNAREESLRAETENERRNRLLELLQRTLGLDEPPRRIEAYDISNMGSFGIVASMTVFEDGKPAKRQYRKFHMKTVTSPDDYASMRETIGRRLDRFRDGDARFAPLPDLMLIDGGAGQVASAAEAMRERGFHLPVYGMVKDDRHRTRALVTENGREIGIRQTPALFSFVGNIQEETHRFAIEYNRKLREKTIGSDLEKIPGVGETRRKLLMERFHTIKAVREASAEELSAVVPARVAENIYRHYH